MIDKYDRIKRNLFLEKGKQDTLSTAEVEVSRRWTCLVSIMMQHPLISRSELVNFLSNGGIVTENGVLLASDYPVKLFNEVSKATAYRDVQEVQTIVGNMSDVYRKYLRYQIYETQRAIIEESMRNGNHDTAIAAMNVLVKAYKLDKDEQEDTDWNAMPQPSFEPSGDMSLLGIDNLKTLQDYQRQRKQLHQRLNITIPANE